MTNYHDRPELSYSKLKVFCESPRLYEATFIHRTRKAKQSASTELGTLIHAGLLEDNIDDVCVVLPDTIKKRDPRVAAFREFAAQHEGKMIVSEDTRSIALDAVETARKNSVVKSILTAEAIKEVPIDWKHSTGVAMRAKPDIVLPSKRLVPDVKTCSNVDEYEFAKQIRSLYYDLQAAVYLEGCQAVYGDGEWNWVWIAIETEAPYRVRTYVLDADDRLTAEAYYHRQMADFADRLRRNDWSDPDENKILPIRTLRRFEK